jgi:hypothetical protein
MLGRDGGTSHIGDLRLKVRDNSAEAWSTIGLISRMGGPGVSAGLVSRHSEYGSALPHLLESRSLPKFSYPRTIPPTQAPSVRSCSAPG